MLCPQESVVGRTLEIVWLRLWRELIVSLIQNWDLVKQGLAKPGIFLQLIWNIKLYLFDFGSW